MPKIFCDNPRDDSVYQTGRIFDHPALHFGKEELFCDVDSVRLGRDVATLVTEPLARSKVPPAIIGDDWISACEKRGADV